MWEPPLFNISEYAFKFVSISYYSKFSKCLIFRFTMSTLIYIVDYCNQHLCSIFHRKTHYTNQYVTPIIFLNQKGKTSEKISRSSHNAFLQFQIFCMFRLHSKTLIPSVTTLHCDYMVDTDGVVTIINWRQHSDYTAIGSSVTVLLAVNNGDYTISVHHVVTVQCSDWWDKSFAVYVVQHESVKHKTSMATQQLDLMFQVGLMIHVDAIFFSMKLTIFCKELGILYDPVMCCIM